MIFPIRNAVVMFLIIIMLHLLLCATAHNRREPAIPVSQETEQIQETPADIKHRELLQYVMQQDTQSSSRSPIPSEVSIQQEHNVLPYDIGDDTCFALCSPVDFVS
jgi:hypothetical protein